MTRPPVRQYVRSGRAFRRWYVHARGVVDRLAISTGRPYARCADILAITSPRCSVQRNLNTAFNYLLTSELGPDVPRSTRAALAHYEETGEIRGPKTGAFARALKGDETACVVDTHMANAYGYDPKDARSKRVRGRIRRSLYRVARLEGLTIAQAQACIWAGYYRSAYPTGRIPRYRWRAVKVFGVPF